MNTMKTGIGLYGVNGHQITRHLEKHTTAQLIAVAGFEPQHLPETFRNESNIKRYGSLAELLKDPKVELVSLCSPRRRDQADDAITCLRAGKHVYAEKPAALSEADLDRILAAAKETGKHFHEMAGSVFHQPFLGMRKVVQTGTLGTIVQVFAQKSYPYHDRRPIDEDMDGGLVCQAGIHAVRFVEHIAGVRVKNVEAVETGLGNPRGGGLKMAASYLLQLENGGVGSIVANYLNPTGFGNWGNEHVRIFGTNGFIETTDGGTRTRLVVKDKDLGQIDVSAPEKDYFDSFVEFLRDKTPMPLTLEDELHPLRVVLRAKQSALAHK
jgi:predicted dehydrogenase